MSTTAVITHSAGINWGQAIATGATVLSGLSIITAFINNRLEKYRQRNAKAMQEVARAFADTLADRLGIVETHLKAQDSTAEEIKGRLWRIEESFMTARRRWFGRKGTP